MSVSVANRHMIYTEILAAVMSGMIGIGVIFSRGTVWAAINKQPDFLGLSYRLWIGAPLVMCALALLIVCALEWDSGRRWNEYKLKTNATIREWLCLMLCLSNITMAIEVIRLGSFWVAPIVIAHAFTLSVAFAFAAVKNRRLCIVLDPRHPTERLRARMPTSW